MSNNGQQMNDSVDRVYAGALLEMAREQGRLDEVADEVDQLAELMRAEPGLRRLLASPAVARHERASSIERIFKGNLSDTLYNFLQVLNQRGRLDKLPSISQTFADMVAQERGLIEVDIFVPERLEASLANDVAARIGKALGKETVLHQYVDPSLIGGLKIRVGDRLIDGSVATQLKHMRRQLVAAGREKARRIARESSTTSSHGQSK